MFEDAISMLSIFASMNTWLTPTVLFLVLNLMIGTIAFTSSFTSHKPNNHHINHHHHHFHHPQPPLQPPTLTRAPSVLQRLKSTMSFSSFYSHHYHHQPSTTTIITPTTSTTTYYQPRQPEPEPDPEPEQTIAEEEEEEEEEEGPTLDEVYSRIKQANINPHYGRQNSDTKPSNGEIPVKLPQKMKKSASDKSAFNHFELHNNNNNVNVGPGASIMEDDDDDVDDREEVEEEGVDAKADDFINKFKKQLELQRNESIVRYKQMIHSRTPHVQ